MLEIQEKCLEVIAIRKNGTQQQNLLRKIKLKNNSIKKLMSYTILIQFFFVV